MSEPGNIAGVLRTKVRAPGATGAPAEQDLPLFQAAPSDANVLWLERYLKECREWVLGKNLCVLVNQDERWLRSVAEASAWVISGQKGYKHVENATAEEVNRFVNWMESQGKKMIARAERLRRNAHAVFG